MSGYIVVLFGGPADGWCSLNMCPLGTADLFPTLEAAEAYAESVPAAFEPHVISVREPTVASSASASEQLEQS